MEISVVITNHNYGRFVARAIRSVLNQSFNQQEYEVLVIDDYSTDNSRDVLAHFDGKVKVLYNDANLGLAASCNKAIKEAAGKYVVRLDADDYVAKDWLLILHAFLSSNKDEMDAVCSDYLEVDVKEQTLKRKSGVTWPIACGLLFKVDDFLQLGGYDEGLPREDFDFRERLIRARKQVYNIPVALYRYTQHNESLTKNL
jgi:glycosyltransferase involved in cell wall biosynthesis